MRNLIIAAIVMGGTLLIGGIWLIKRRIGWGTHKPTGPRPAKSAPAGDRLMLLARSISNTDLREFLQEISERVQKAGPNIGEEDRYAFVEEIVDRVDDLRAILTSRHGQESEWLNTFRRTLVEVLSDAGVELIHSDHWDPSIQRAIAKEPSSGLEAPSILRFGSTGIRRHGQLMRKQEVVLAVPQPNS